MLFKADKEGKGHAVSACFTVGCLPSDRASEGELGAPEAAGSRFAICGPWFSGFLQGSTWGNEKFWAAVRERENCLLPSWLLLYTLISLQMYLWFVVAYLFVYFNICLKPSVSSSLSHFLPHKGIPWKLCCCSVLLVFLLVFAASAHHCPVTLVLVPLGLTAKYVGQWLCF